MIQLITKLLCLMAVHRCLFNHMDASRWPRFSLPGINDWGYWMSPWHYWMSGHDPGATCTLVNCSWCWLKTSMELDIENLELVVAVPGFLCYLKISPELNSHCLALLVGNDGCFNRMRTSLDLDVYCLVVHSWLLQPTEIIFILLYLCLVQLAKLISNLCISFTVKS